MMLTKRRFFSTKPPKPSLGFKMPKLKDGEEIVAFKPSGSGDIFSKTKNFNYEQQRRNFEQTRFKVFKGLVLFSFIPIFYFVKNAE